MNTYEKPYVEIIDFTTENVMSGGAGEGITSPEEGWE